MTFSLYRSCSGGASFSRVGSVESEGSLAFGWLEREGRVISGRTSARSERCIREWGAIRDGGCDLSSPSSLPPVARCARPYLPESLAFPPTHPLTSPQAAVWSDLGLTSQTSAAMGTGTGARLGVLKVSSFSCRGPLGPCSCPSLPRPGHPSLLCHACWYSPIPATLCPAVHLHLPLWPNICLFCFVLFPHWNH